jgi:hypothetical protein
MTVPSPAALPMSPKLVIQPGGWAPDRERLKVAKVTVR